MNISTSKQAINFFKNKIAHQEEIQKNYNEACQNSDIETLDKIYTQYEKSKK
jgi:hypothetical protein